MKRKLLSKRSSLDEGKIFQVFNEVIAYWLWGSSRTQGSNSAAIVSTNHNWYMQVSDVGLCTKNNKHCWSLIHSTLAVLYPSINMHIHHRPRIWGTKAKTIYWSLVAHKEWHWFFFFQRSLSQFKHNTHTVPWWTTTAGYSWHNVLLPTNELYILHDL